MSEAAFAVDDDWGTGLTEIEYPTLHSKQQVSKSVLRKRRKAAQRLQELSKNAVLPGWALQSITSHTKSATSRYCQKRQWS